MKVTRNLSRCAGWFIKNNEKFLIELRKRFFGTMLNLLTTSTERRYEELKKASVAPRLSRPS